MTVTDADGDPAGMQSVTATQVSGDGRVINGGPAATTDGEYTFTFRAAGTTGTAEIDVDVRSLDEDGAATTTGRVLRTLSLTIEVGEPAPEPAAMAFTPGAAGTALQFTSFRGGSISDLQGALLEECSNSGVVAFVTTAGGFVGYIPGARLSAPNAAFRALFPDDAVPAGQILLVVNCAAARGRIRYGEDARSPRSGSGRGAGAAPRSSGRTRRRRHRMRIAKGSALAGVAAALFALLLAPVLTGAGAAHAQNPPASFYGSGLMSGDTVTAMIGDASCGTATADASGGWAIQVAQGTCGAANGMMVSFMVNDAMAKETATWMSGGLPDNAAEGITLTVDAMDGGEGTMVPVVTETGNAGLAAPSGGAGAASWLAAGLGLLALAGAAGARIATARRTG